MNTLKKIFSLLLVISMILSVLSLTACNKDKGNDDDKGKENVTNNGNKDKTYTVTVVDGDNNPVEGVKLIITDETKYPIVTTDKNGKASVSFPEATINVMITSVPDGYEKPKAISKGYHAIFESGSTELTLKIEKKADNNVTYTVRVIDQNGKPVEGMSVQLCYNGICAAPVATNEDGEVNANLAPDTVIDVKLYALDGFVLPDPVNGEYHAVIEEGDLRIDVVVTRV